MSKFRKKPVVIEATRWFKDGDHPAVELARHEIGVCDHLGITTYPPCGRKMSEHGRIHTLEGTMVVCPGDWVITGIKGEHYSCRADIFEATYEAVEDHDVPGMNVDA